MEDSRPLETMVSTISGKGLPSRIISDGDPARLCVAGDLFFGMASILLFEAALAGKTALSVQIGLCESGAADPCATNASGWTISVTDRAFLDKHIKSILSKSEPPMSHRQPFDFVGASVLAAKVVEQTHAMQTFPPQTKSFSKT